MSFSERVDARVAGMLNDPRDTVFVYLMAQCAALGLFGIALFIPGVFSWWLAAIYLPLWAFGLLDRFILMLHCTSHRQLFNRDYRRLNHVIPWALGPFFGQTPETYFSHHMGMHHVEGNLENDLSSTMRFQRDSFLHWLRYFGRFLTIGLLELFHYHHKRGNTKLARRTLIGEGAFFLLVIVLAVFVDWRATFVVFLGPVIGVRFLMMAGNWGQHAFIAQGEPDNDFKSSITCINTRYNRRCFNDGYHIIHHRKPRLHYTEMDVEFEEHRSLYGEQDAIVFDGIDFFQVWLFLMLGRKSWLARRFVRLPGAPDRTDAEVIAFLNERLRPVRRELSAG